MVTACLAVRLRATTRPPALLLQCGITKENNVSLFLFHGKTETFKTMELDVFGEEEEHYQWYYTQPVRRFFQAVERNPWFERTVRAAHWTPYHH